MAVRHPTNNAARISGLLRDVTWRNKCMTVESKIKIYKAVSRMTDNNLRGGNKSGHHQNKTTFKDNRDENFEGHSRQDKV